MLTRISIGVAVLMMSWGVAAQSAVYECTGGDEGKRITDDKFDVRIAEHCTELGSVAAETGQPEASQPATPNPKAAKLRRQAAAKAKAEASRPPTRDEQLKMTGLANRMDFWKLCPELGRVLRRVGATNPKQQFWANAVISSAQVPMIDHAYIRERRLRIGMDECSVVAILGQPDTMNRSNTARGRSDQLVYRSKRIYVYTENGIVSSWQE